MNEEFNIPDLIIKSITDEINALEKEVLKNWINESPENKELFEKLADVQYQTKKLEEYNSYRNEALRDKIENQLFTRKVNFFQEPFMRYAAAILLPLLITISGVLYFRSKDQINMATIDEDIKPGSSKATLILSDGNQVVLDQSFEDETVEEKGVRITNKDNRLNYSVKDEEKNTEPVFNELKTPRGGGYNLTLADGTQVWVNSASSVRFPVEFTDSVRQVYLKGEAYFDVSHSGKPFIVASENMNVRVLGTKFNVTAYEDEALITTTLVEGKVKIETTDDEYEDRNQVLIPGMQAEFQKADKEIQVNKVNTSQYTSWIEGKLEFHNLELDLVMKRLARWYDFDYSFENESAKGYHFSARISANESISEVFNMLEMTTDVEFRIENNTIVIN